MTSTVFRAARRLLLDLSSRTANHFGGKGGDTGKIVSLASCSTSATSPPESPTVKGTVKVTKACQNRLKEILDTGTFLRVTVESGGCSGFQYIFSIDRDIYPQDVVIHKYYSACIESPATPMVVMDELTLDLIQGSTLDYHMELIRCAFQVTNNPRAFEGCSCGASFNMKIDI